MARKSLFKSISNWFRGKRDEAVDAMADPVRDGKIAIEDSEDQCQDLEGKIAKVMAEASKLNRELAAAKLAVAKYEGLSKSAAQAGNEDHLRTALEHKNEAVATVAALQASAARMSQEAAKLRSVLKGVREKIRTAKSGHSLMSARSTAATIRRDAADAASGLGEALEGLEEFSNAVYEQEAMADAYEDLNADPLADLEAAYANGSVAVDQEMAKMLAAAHPPAPPTPAEAAVKNTPVFSSVEEAQTFMGCDDNGECCGGDSCD